MGKLRKKLRSFAMDNHIKKYGNHNAKQLEYICNMFACDLLNYIADEMIFFDESKKWQTKDVKDCTSIEIIYKFKQEKGL